MFYVERWLEVFGEYVTCVVFFRCVFVVSSGWVGHSVGLGSEPHCLIVMFVSGRGFPVLCLVPVCV